jgi:hypothetical protein
LIQIKNAHLSKKQESKKGHLLENINGNAELTKPIGLGIMSTGQDKSEDTPDNETYNLLV